MRSKSLGRYYHLKLLVALGEKRWRNALERRVCEFVYYGATLVSSRLLLGSLVDITKIPCLLSRRLENSATSISLAVLSKWHEENSSPMEGLFGRTACSIYNARTKEKTKKRKTNARASWPIEMSIRTRVARGEGEGEKRETRVPLTSETGGSRTAFAPTFVIALAVLAFPTAQLHSSPPPSMPAQAAAKRTPAQQLSIPHLLYSTRLHSTPLLPFLRFFSNGERNLPQRARGIESSSLDATLGLL